jgi:hypothetical protein
MKAVSDLLCPSPALFPRQSAVDLKRRGDDPIGRLSMKYQHLGLLSSVCSAGERVTQQEAIL